MGDSNRANKYHYQYVKTDFQHVKMFLVKLMNTMKMLQVLRDMVGNPFIEMNMLRNKDSKIGREIRNDILTRRR